MKIGLMIDDDELRRIPVSHIKRQFVGIKNKQWVDSKIPMSFIEQDGYDLIVLDYGGISIGIGNSLSESYAKYVNKYAEEHPNTLIVYITGMGKQFLEMEGINFADLQNIKWGNYSEVKEIYDKWLLSGK